MARPRTDRTERIYIRLTSEEKDAIESKASALGLTGADWLRKTGLSRKLPGGKLDAEARRQMLAQLVGMARNMNQLTVLAHRSHVDAEGLEGIRTSVEELLDRVGRL
ncbi:MAG TPA: hypothetical protein VE954_42635 [Oligoflexus sp.]|uniref:plasmid mobilization protein n=1 Tax=Oligoflexus sp. TaxID=1971216 RepID=UPI002D3F3987|nr:hypothetical protein [Oligoflexus sp.]HYX39840.1 hypothetical protein [Oligoflexus sp.]